MIKTEKSQKIYNKIFMLMCQLNDRESLEQILFDSMFRLVDREISSNSPQLSEREIRKVCRDNIRNFHERREFDNE